MRKINYYVATSLDGFIAGPNGEINGFQARGEGVDKYLNDLNTFDTVIMGRRTYEFGYQFGLKPGQPAYPHMKHYIFSDNLKLPEPHDLVQVCPIQIELIRKLKRSAGTDIYLCGGSVFASWLLQHQMIDLLTIKLNPFLMGFGIPLFANLNQNYKLKLLKSTSYEDGLLISAYEIVY